MFDNLYTELDIIQINIYLNYDLIKNFFLNKYSPYRLYVYHRYRDVNNSCFNKIADLSHTNTLWIQYTGHGFE